MEGRSISPLGTGSLCHTPTSCDSREGRQHQSSAIVHIGDIQGRKERTFEGDSQAAWKTQETKCSQGGGCSLQIKATPPVGGVSEQNEEKSYELCGLKRTNGRLPLTDG